MSKPPRKVTPFSRGWHDKLNLMPIVDFFGEGAYENALAYERGRHAAALYAHWCHVGTIKPVARYAEARLQMPIELRKLIDLERRFCMWRPRKKRGW